MNLIKEDDIVAAIESIDEQAQALSTCTSQLIQQIKPILENKMGAVRVRDSGGSKFDFEADHFQCPLCMGNHAATPYSCTPLLGVCCCIRNHQSHCRDTVIGLTDHPILQQLIKNPEGDAPYVKLFEAHQLSRGIVWKFDGETFYKFDGVRWQPQSTYDLSQQLGDVTREFLGVLSSLTQLDQTNTEKRHKPPLIRAAEAVQSSHKIHSIVRDCKAVFNDSSLKTKLDSSAFHLGCDNGVIDLHTGIFRSSIPSDYVSMSVGYNYLDKWDDDITEELETFLAKIYPMEEERNLIQRYESM